VAFGEGREAGEQVKIHARWNGENDQESERRTMTSIPDPIENPHLSETDLALSERHVKIQTRAYELYLERGDGPEVSSMIG
jgi:hypothetical protein